MPPSVIASKTIVGALSRSAKEKVRERPSLLAERTNIERLTVAHNRHPPPQMGYALPMNRRMYHATVSLPS